MADAPAWARHLVARICADAGVPEPLLRWRGRDRPTSSGVARRSAGTVSVVAGTDLVDQRLTLLHELAHWISPPSRRRRRTAHHGLAFYRTAFALYRRHGIAEEVALAGEAARYPSALRHAAALGVAGARPMLAARRAAQRARPRRRWRVLVPEHVVRLERDGRWTVCSTCRQRVVGRNLAIIRRARRPVRHVLLTALPA